MHAFAVSRPLILANRPVPSPTCAHRPTLAQRAVVRPSSPARATLSSSDSGVPTGSASSMGSPAPSASSNAVQDARSIAEVTAGLSAADESRISSVRSQMEFWFSASNLRRDWYLRRQMDQEGWLDPSVFLLFNRIKNLNANLGDIILACKSSDELEVASPGAASFGDDAGQTRVRRSPDLPNFREDDDHEVARSFILRGIPADSTVDSLLELFKPLGLISYARIYRSKNFPDGPRALICFPDQETADSAYQKFLTEKPDEMKDIFMRKRERSYAAQGGTSSSSSDFEARPSLLICHITGLSPELDWKTLYKTLDTVFTERTGESMRYLMYVAASEHCHVTCNDSEAVRILLAELSEGGLQIDNAKTTVKLLEDEADIKEYWKMATEHQNARKARRAREGYSPVSSSESAMRRPTGVIVQVGGLDEEVTWRDLKMDLGRLGKLVYLNHERGSRSCYVRFSSPEEATAVREALSGPDAATVCGSAVEAAVLDGEEEADYWKRADELQKERRSNRDSPPMASS